MLIWISSPETAPRNCILLDRDGVLNVDRSDYVKCWSEYVFYPDALEAMGWLHQRGIHPILISNQSALNRGIMRWEDHWEMHTRMLERIRDAGGDLLAAFYCPHRPDEHCACRKPAPGMIKAATELFGLDVGQQIFIGDNPTDLEAAQRAGCRGVFLDRLEVSGASRTARAIDPHQESYPTLLDAVKALGAQSGVWGNP